MLIDSHKRDCQKNRILESVHEAAKGLYKIGLINKSKMEEYDFLCLKPLSDISKIIGDPD